MSAFDVITLIGGLSLFLYGMRLMGDSLKKNTSAALKRALEKVTNNPVIGFVLGLSVTALIQSSTATIVLTAGLVGAGLLTLRQSIGVVLGANVGTTVTGQIIRLMDINVDSDSWMRVFDPSTLAPLALTIGIVLVMVAPSKALKTSGEIAIGFGLLFTGLMSMSSAVEPLKDSETFANLISRYLDSHVLAFAAGFLFTALIKSSSAAVGMLQALSVTGVFSFSSVYSILLGINMGDCVTTAILCGIGAKPDPKRSGLIHVMVNLSSSILIILGITLAHNFGWLDGVWSGTMNSGHIANTHTLFKLSTAILLLPLTNTFYRLSLRIVKDRKTDVSIIDKELSELDDKLIATPSLAIQASTDAIDLMGRIAFQNTERAHELLKNYDSATAANLVADEDNIDRLADAVDNYMIKASAHIQTEEQNNQLNFLIQCFPEFERIGDYAVNLLEDVQALREQKIEFSEMAKKELDVLFAAIREITEQIRISFASRDPLDARRVEPLEEVIDDLVALLKERHINRLKDGKCSIYAGLQFLDVLINAERIADQCSNVGVYILSLSDAMAKQSHHDYIKALHQGGDPIYLEAYNRHRGTYMGALAALHDEVDAVS